MSIFVKSWAELTEEDEDYNLSPVISSKNHDEQEEENIKKLTNIIDNVKLDQQVSGNNNNISSGSSNSSNSSGSSDSNTIQKKSIKNVSPSRKYLASKLNRKPIQIPVKRKLQNIPTKKEELDEEDEYEEEEYGEEEYEEEEEEEEGYEEGYGGETSFHSYNNNSLKNSKNYNSNNSSNNRNHLSPNNSNNKNYNRQQQNKTKEDIFFRNNKNSPNQSNKIETRDLRELINEENRKSPSKSNISHHIGSSGNYSREDKSPIKNDLRELINSEKRKANTPNHKPNYQEGKDTESSLMSARFSRLNNNSNNEIPQSPIQNQNHHKPQQRSNLSTPITNRRDINDLTPYSSPNPSTPNQRFKQSYQNSPSTTRGPLNFNTESPSKQSQQQQQKQSSPAIKINMNDVKPIIGTCKDYEKPYLRLTGKADPSKIRPIDILETWFPKLVRKYQSNKNYNYALDQLKSIRQDLMIQHIRNKFTLNVYETNARICLENLDYIEFGQCLSQIKELYETIESENQFEFLSYDLLFTLLFSDNELVTLLPKIINDPNLFENQIIKHSFEVVKSVLNKNYCKFNKLYLNCFNMEKYLLDKILNEKLRVYSLDAMIKSYKPSIHFNFLEKELSFSNQDELIQFLEKDYPKQLNIDKEKQELICSIKKK